MTSLGAVLGTFWTLIDDAITARCALLRDLNQIICDDSWIRPRGIARLKNVTCTSGC